MIYFGLWLVIDIGLSTLSQAQNRGMAYGVELQRALCGLGLVIYGVTLHFASVDWILRCNRNITRRFAGHCWHLNKFFPRSRVRVIACSLLYMQPPIVRFVSKESLNDLGSLLLAFIVVWGYMWWFEFMLTWIANLPADVIWYGGRTRDNWLWIATVIAVLGFIIPFLLLLQKAIKQRPTAMRRVGILILLTQLAFMNWEILPAFRPTGFGSWWISLLAPLAVGGWWVALFIMRDFGNVRFCHRTISICLPWFACD